MCCLNVDMADLISTAPKDLVMCPTLTRARPITSGISLRLKDTIYYLHGWGSNGREPLWR